MPSVPFQGHTGQTSSLGWLQLSDPSDLPCSNYNHPIWYKGLSVLLQMMAGFIITGIDFCCRIIQLDWKISISYHFYPLAFQAEGVLSLPASVRLSIRLSVYLSVRKVICLKGLRASPKNYYGNTTPSMASSHHWRNVWRNIAGSRPNWAQDFTRTSQKNSRTSQKNYYQHSRNFWNFLFLLIIPITQAIRCTTGWSDSGCWGADTS